MLIVYEYKKKSSQKGKNCGNSFFGFYQLLTTEKTNVLYENSGKN